MIKQRIITNTFLQEKDGHILSRFFQVIKDQGLEGEKLLGILERTRDVTLFAPSNNALEGDLTLNTIMSDKNKFLEILKLHIVVDDRLYVDKILKNTRSGVSYKQFGKSVHIKRIPSPECVDDGKFHFKVFVLNLYGCNNMP